MAIQRRLSPPDSPVLSLQCDFIWLGTSFPLSAPGNPQFLSSCSSISASGFQLFNHFTVNLAFSHPSDSFISLFPLSSLGKAAHSYPSLIPLLIYIWHFSHTALYKVLALVYFHTTHSTWRYLINIFPMNKQLKEGRKTGKKGIQKKRREIYILFWCPNLIQNQWKQLHFLLLGSLDFRCHNILLQRNMAVLRLY